MIALAPHVPSLFPPSMYALRPALTSRSRVARAASVSTEVCSRLSRVEVYRRCSAPVGDLGHSAALRGAGLQGLRESGEEYGTREPGGVSGMVRKLRDRDQGANDVNRAHLSALGIRVYADVQSRQ